MRQAWLLAVLAAMALSCAAQPHNRRWEERERKASEILMHSSNISKWRKELGLTPRPDARRLAPSWEGWHPPAQPRSEECGEVCDLGEYICDAKEQICRIADELGDDAWAQEKCESARDSCREARKRCHDCNKAAGQSGA